MNGNYIKCTITRKGFELIPANESNSYLTVGGVRIEEITNYDKNGEFINKSIYEYKVPDKVYSSGELTRGVKENITTNDIYVQYKSGSLESNCVSDKNDCPKTTPTLIVYDSPMWGLENGGSPVIYEYVTEKIVDKNGVANGKEVSYFFNNKMPYDALTGQPKIPYIDNQWYRGLLKRKTIYNSENIIIKETEYDYGYEKIQDIVGFVAVRNQDYDFVAESCCDGIQLPIDWNKWVHNNYSLSSAWKPKISETIKEIDKSGNELIINKNYTYTAAPNYQLLKSVSQSLGNDQTIFTEYLYSFELEPTNTFANILEKKKYLQISGGAENVIEAQFIKYLENETKPIEVYNWEKTSPDGSFSDLYLSGSSYIKDNDYNQFADTEISYNWKSRPTLIKKVNGEKTVYVWSNDNKYVLAKVNNCDNSSKAVTESFEPGQACMDFNQSGVESAQITQAKSGTHYYSLSSGNIEKTQMAGGEYIVELWVDGAGNPSINGQAAQCNELESSNRWKRYFKKITVTENSAISISGSGNVDEIRIYPSDAQMISYSYKDLVGVTTITDPNGVSAYYDYDENGRLKAGYDNPGNIINKYEYNYIK